ncbi:MAG: helix-turn-helix transcriptional regulator [Paraprevotella sp.]|nr:helix-turn-helix transcriptional regulator [Paraprevotella sp.]
MAGKLDYEYCQAAPVLEWMSRKWALVVLLRMEEACGTDRVRKADGDDGGIRFGDLFRSIPQISEKVLAATLDYLEGEGLVDRYVSSHVCPHVSYRLMPLAADFLREISYVIEWGQLHFSEIERGRRKHCVNTDKQ